MHGSDVFSTIRAGVVPQLVGVYLGTRTGQTMTLLTRAVSGGSAPGLSPCW
jgi:hypothetical protein